MLTERQRNAIMSAKERDISAVGADYEYSQEIRVKGEEIEDVDVLRALRVTAILDGLSEEQREILTDQSQDKARECANEARLSRMFADKDGASQDYRDRRLRAAKCEDDMAAAHRAIVRILEVSNGNV